MPATPRPRSRNAAGLWCASLAERLCRTCQDMPLREIARATGYNHETIRRYLLRGRVPAHFVVAFAQAFRVSAAWLLTGRGR